MLPPSHKLIGSPNIYIYIYKSRDLMWESMRFCQVAHSLSLSHLSFHLIKIYIYVKLLVHWMYQWSEYTLIIYKYALYIYIYIYKNFIWFFFLKNYIRKKKYHIRSIPRYWCMLSLSHKLVEPTSMGKHEVLSRHIHWVSLI